MVVNFHLPILDRLKDPWALPAYVYAKPYLYRKMSFSSKSILQALGGYDIRGHMLLKQLFLAYQGKKLVRNVQKGTHMLLSKP